MNALTFGLLITALSGFARGQSLTLIGAELLVLVVVGFSSCAASFLCPSLCYPSTCYAFRFFTLDRHVNLLVLRANVSHGLATFYLQTVLGRSEVETGLLLTPRPLATMVMAPLAGYLIERLHAGLLGALGMVIMAAGLFALVMLPASPPI